MCAPSSLVDVRPVEAVDVRLSPERPEDAAAVVALVERAFGPGRYAKVSERLREGNRMKPALSFCAFSGDRLVGTVRQWPIVVGQSPGVFLGPIAVEGASRRHGVGGLLIARCVKAAADAGEAFILLVGDLALFGPYGFNPVPPDALTMPGPVDPRRVLVCSLNDEKPESLVGRVQAPRLTP